MQVRLTRILVPPFPTNRYWDGGRELHDHPRLKIGAEYVVGAIVVRPQGAEFMIFDRSGEYLSQMPWICFETTSTRIPSHWVAAVNSDDHMVVGPPAWVDPGFWGDDYLESPWPREKRDAARRQYAEDLATTLREA